MCLGSIPDMSHSPALGLITVYPKKRCMRCWCIEDWLKPSWIIGCLIFICVTSGWRVALFQMLDSTKKHDNSKKRFTSSQKTYTNNRRDTEQHEANLDTQDGNNRLSFCLILAGFWGNNYFKNRAFTQTPKSALSRKFTFQCPNLDVFFHSSLDAAAHLNANQ